MKNRKPGHFEDYYIWYQEAYLIPLQKTFVKEKLPLFFLVTFFFSFFFFLTFLKVGAFQLQKQCLNL